MGRVFGVTSMIKISRQQCRLAAAALCLILGASAFADESTPMQASPSPPPGYLKPAELPDSIALLPRPPELGSSAEALDLQTASAMLKLQDTPRFALAALDADLSFPAAAGTFSCALGVPITAEATPTLYRLLIRVMADAGAATGAAKDKYQHARPFMLDGEPTCRPSDEARLRANGSYPSGHTSIGWAWAQVLAEVAPDRAEAVLERGRVFGESRLVCNVHWASDVLEGRIVGAATVAREHGNPEFRADVAAARDEYVAVSAKNLAPQRDCKAEAEALKQTPWLTP